MSRKSKATTNIPKAINSSVKAFVGTFVQNK